MKKIIYFYETVKAYDKSENTRQTLELCLSLACFTFRNGEGKAYKAYLSRQNIERRKNLESENVYNQGFLEIVAYFYIQ